jgi:hypothetical protein
MATPPPVPPVADSDRYVAYAPGGVSTATVDVPFPIYGDQSDLTVLVDGLEWATSKWSLVSASGSALSNIAQPITDGRVAFWPAVSADTIEVIGNIHPRQTVMPTMPGIPRREFNLTVGYVLSTLRELWRRAVLGSDEPFGFDASGPLSEQPQYGDQPKGFRFAQLDASSGRPLLFVKLSDDIDDWSQALDFRGAPGADGAAGAGSLTNLATGFGLKGGPITTTGTVGMDPVSFGWGIRNRLFNGSMAIDQRNAGTAYTLGVVSGTTNYSLDRWYSYLGASGTGITATRIASFLQRQFAMRVQRANGSSTTSVVNIAQVLESSQCIFLRGLKATLSIELRAGPDFSGSGGVVNYSISQGEGTDQSAAAFAGGTWTSQSVISSATLAVTETTQRVALTVTVPTTASQLAVRIWWTPSGTAGAGDYVDIAHVQLEPGEVAASEVSFEHRPISFELAACQRYFCKSYSQSVKPGAVRTAGVGGITAGSLSGYTNAYHPISFPATMRTAPSVTVYDNDGDPNVLSFYLASWVNGEAATINNVTDGGASISFTEPTYFISFDYAATAEL